MPRDLSAGTDRDQHLNEVLLAYVEAVQAGHEPDRDQLLADNPDLRHELEAFLDGHDEMERLTASLRRSCGGEIPFHPEGRASGVAVGDSLNRLADSIGQLGDFCLLREVGRGGMGVVYEAEQVSLRRRVALKVLPFAAAIDPRRLQRFKTEALAAAHLRHEKIVPVHAVGCERGVHYYAMQFIDGQSLSALIDELRRLRAKDGPRHSTVAPKPGTASSSPAARPAAESRTVDSPGDLVRSAPRFTPTTPAADPPSQTTAISREWSSGGRRYFERVAAVGCQAAQALEHAHQAGIVHRDIKPSNLLLDLREQVWITDFGLAQVNGDPGLTATGELLGTLRYASPEQILARRGIVDHRSDIYSLGATLYELLTLRPLFEGAERNELIRRIADDEPPRPCSLDPSIPADLETIVLKALRKDPGDRYATAQDLADDLQHFLDDQPIQARRPTPAERLRTWSRRHPSIVAGGVIVLILLSIASLVSAALIRREQAKTFAEQLKAEAAYRHERQRAEEAEARLRLARRAVDELIQFSEEELAHHPGMDGLRKRLLTSALDYYQEFLDQRRNDPGAQAELRDTTRRVEKILADLAVLRAGGHLYLLIQPPAIEDLRLNQDQREKIAELSTAAGKRWLKSFGEQSRLSLSERRREALEQARANEAAIDAILTPTQQQRLRQLALQSAGLGAFREPEVIATLRLTHDQREQIRAIEAEELFARMRTMGHGRSSAEVSREPNVAPPLDRIITLLTEEQSQRWRELIGEPLDGSLSAFPLPFSPKRERRRSSH